MKKLVITGLLGLVAWGMVASSAMAQGVDRSRVAISPYVQSGGTSNTAANNFYSFLAFSHPSLSTAVSQIQITVSVEGPASTSFVPSGDNSETFTINAGETHKVFIVATNHASINPTTNASAFGARDHFITTTTTGINGNVRVLASNTTPTVEVTTGKYNNLNQLSMWGVIFQPSNGAGFAMEFIGDMHDSTVLPDGNGGNVVTLSTGRGIN